MKMTEALAALSALSQRTRLGVFRLLVREGAAGLPAGEIAQRMNVMPSTMSGHLNVLEHAVLVRSWRVQRQIFYAVEPSGIQGLLAFLLEDCCQGNPDICVPILESMAGRSKLPEAGEAQADGCCEGASDER